MRKRIFILYLILIVSSYLYGRDWYVRPEGGTYGLENGTSYQNAWDGLLRVIWGSAGVQPGDTLWVCGLHIHTVTNRWSPAIDQQGDIVPSSGISESARIVIRGDYPGDPGIIWGAYNMGYESWVNEGDNTWSITLPGWSFSDWFFQDITADSWTILTPRSSIAAIKANPGSFYSANYQQNSKLYVKCSDSGNPTGRIYGNRYGYQWILTNKSYITFKNLKIYAHYRFLRPGVTDTAAFIRWEGCTMWYGEHSIICANANCDGFEVIDCNLAWASNGIYNITNTNDYPADYVYRGNKIHDIGVRPSTQNNDAHAIGVQGSNNGLIEDNYIYNCGNAILLYAFTNQTFTNTIVRGNLVKNCHTYGMNPGYGGYGISTQCDNDSLSNKTGNKFYQNIVINCPVGF